MHSSQNNLVSLVMRLPHTVYCKWHSVFISESYAWLSPEVFSWWVAATCHSNTLFLHNFLSWSTPLHIIPLMTLGSVEIEHGALLPVLVGNQLGCWKQKILNSWVSSRPHSMKLTLMKWQSICSHHSCFWPLLEIILACNEQEWVISFFKKTILKGKFTYK